MTGKSDDEISLTSTTPSEQLSEYEVESVLGELEAPDGQPQYLVKWRGYPIERCSWEPADSFNTPETLADWARTKRAIEEGRRQPFDIIKWENHVFALEEASQERKRKRAAKRQSLGLPRRLTGIASNERRTSDVPLTGSRSDAVGQPVTKATASHNAQPALSSQPKPPKPAPPPILFGSGSEKRPQTARKASNTDPNNRFSLSTRWRYEKAKRDEPPPNIDQLDLVPPSKWTPMSNPNAAKLGPYMVQTTVESESLTDTRRHPENDKTEPPAGPSPSDSPRNTRRADEVSGRIPMDADRSSRFRDSRFDTRRGDEVSDQIPVDADRPRRFRDSRFDTRRGDEVSDQIPVDADRPNRLRDWRFDTRRGDEISNWPPMDANRLDRFRDSRFDAQKGDEVSSRAPVDADRPDRFRDSRSDRPWEPSREPRGKYIIAKNGVKRFLDPGDLLITMHYGPLNTPVGNVRLAGLSSYSRKNLLNCKRDGEVDLWFQYLCSLDEYDRLCQNSANQKYCTGSVHAYEDTEPDLVKFAELLQRRNMVGIFGSDKYPFNVVLVYPPGSTGFGFLSDGMQNDPRSPLHFVVRSTLGRIHKIIPSLRERQQSLQSPVDESISHERTPWITNTPISQRTPWDAPTSQADLHRNSDSTAPLQINLPLTQRVTSKGSQESTILPANTKSPTAFHPPQDTNPPSNNPGSFPSPRDTHPPSNSRGAFHSPQNTSPPRDDPEAMSEPMELDSIPPGSPPSSEPVQTPLPPPASPPAVLPIRPIPPVALAPEPEAVVLQITERPLPPVEGFDLNELFMTHFGITFKSLAAVNMASGSQSFYLMFPEGNETTQQEYQILKAFLDNNNAVVFSNHLPEDWKKFAVSKAGVIVFHKSFVDYYTLPSFREILSGKFTLWNLSLATPLQYVRHRTHIQRIFPHGGVILMTEDFMLRQPRASLIILAWFNDYANKKFPGSWKIMLRPDIINWLSELPEPREPSEHAIWIAMCHHILQLSYTSSQRELDAEILAGDSDEYHESKVISPPFLPNYGSRSEVDNPDIPKGLSQEHRNTDHLAEFFAGWALVNSHVFRHFHVVTQLPPPERWSAWQHVDVKHGPKAFMTAFNIDFKKYDWIVKGKSGPPPSSSTDPRSTQRTPTTPQTPRPGGNHGWRSREGGDQGGDRDWDRRHPQNPSRPQYPQGYK
ncbi:hypothetical protein P168DRAFT_303897 [Aspergillus campestris IBT 28561]|uniref:Chromo domain-containing protein n=1 Tax=Aspergillus campestris (strain IBT 28561) TaxID=1392248 RepID=A0A2I1D4C2_ASPC2|nr:uncharacterized protein P168DRAFT_303897 [Aspergillus campestris IBT 28561]PKY04727.1 hypothetical protein P168DRAFT_303897 [Aspergillus campestris IBT 28561]